MSSDQCRLCGGMKEVWDDIDARNARLVPCPDCAVKKDPTTTPSNVPDWMQGDPSDQK